MTSSRYLMGFMKNHFSSLENAYLCRQEIRGLIEDYRLYFVHRTGVLGTEEPDG